MNQTATETVFLTYCKQLEKAFQEKGMNFSVAAVFWMPFIKH